jgi:hypothetical protein
MAIGSLLYAYVIKQLRLLDQICDLAQAIDDDCGSDEKCAREYLPHLKQMLDACDKRTPWPDD